MLRLLWAIARVFLAIWTRLLDLPRQAAVALGAASLDAPARPAKLGYAMLVVLPIALVVGWTMPQITLVMTPSIEAWALREKPGPIARGDYVLFVFQHPVIGDKPARITKHALCLPGDRLTTIEVPSRHRSGTSDAWYFCNDRFLALSLPAARSGMRLEHMRWSGVIPAGMVYVGSSHPRGFDSRYFGLLPLDRLTRMERIL